MAIREKGKRPRQRDSANAAGSCDSWVVFLVTLYIRSEAKREIWNESLINSNVSNVSMCVCSYGLFKDFERF